eukprot:TRINITY_DN304_c0_g1_i2.p1 TRINITY_DN304_c0_g1~~TRINITY_DN304_c0_g1_i2.p1  ORF type:complete len:527 (-),score=116.73 TRINITY_DN304_c0_g1_i2:76-1482(-)
MLAVDSPDHPGYEDWLQNYDEDESPEHLVIYVYNITNLPAVLAGEKPLLDEVGPYAFRQFKEKIDPFFGDDGGVPIGDMRSTFDKGSVAYFYHYRYFFFDREKSTELGLPLERDPDTDMICTLNSIYAGAVAISPVAEDALYRTGSRYFFGESESEPMLPVTTVAFGREAYQYADAFWKNYTGPDDARADGLRGLRTGFSDINALRRFVMFKGERIWPRWEPHYEPIDGTDGLQFHRGMDKEGVVKSWEVDIERQVYLYNIDGRERDVKGITTRVHRVIERMYQNATYAPENGVFDMVDSYAGTINVTRVALGVPMFVTPAHHLWVDPAITDTVEYVKESSKDQDIDVHASYTCVEPYSGIAFRGGKVGQINIEVRPTTRYPNVQPYTFLPVVWSNEGGSANDAQADEFKNGVVLGLVMKDVMLYVGSILGSLLIVVGAVLVIKWHASMFQFVGDAPYGRQGLLSTNT